MYKIISTEFLPDGKYIVIVTDKNGFVETGTNELQALAFEEAKKKLQEAINTPTNA